MHTLAETWHWRAQIWHLAVIDLMKTVRGAALGWLWLFIKPAIYVFVFWFAISIGLRAGHTSGDYPYILWLVCGLIPWFFMRDMINTGSNVYHRYSYLVNKMKFPLLAISCFYALSQLIIYLVSMAIILVVALICGVHIGLEIVQLPFIIVFMYLFWVCWSVLTSPLSAISKDFANLVRVLSTPLFWLSGIIYDVSSLGIDWLQAILAFNPVTTFAQVHRLAICDGVWVWDRPDILIPFAIVLVITVVLAAISLHRIGPEVADVL